MYKSKLKRMRPADIIFHGFTVIGMGLLTIVMLYPFLYVLNYSLSDPTKIGVSLLLLPKGFNLDSYITLFQADYVLTGLYISTMRTIIGTLTMIIVSSVTGYCLAQKDVVGIKFFRKFFVFTMYVSAGLIPIYLVYQFFGLIGTFWVYIVPLMVGAFNIILVKTYVESLPEALQESAFMDGANDFTIFFRIIFPLIIPVVAAIALFGGIGHWNSYFDAHIFNSMKKELYPLAYALYRKLVSMEIQTLREARIMGRSLTRYDPQTVKYAMTFITVLPIIVVYPFVQRYFMSGMLIGSIKG